MTLKELAAQDWIEVVSSEYDDAQIKGVYTSDLLSDVMANAEEDSVLITIQAHNNAIAVASLAGINGIIICNNRPVPDDMPATARKEHIALFRTAHNQFKTSCLMGKLINGA